MTKYTDSITAEQLIQWIANDYVELSHDKVHWQRNNFMEVCRSWLKARDAEKPFQVVFADTGNPVQGCDTLEEAQEVATRFNEFMKQKVVVK